MINLKNIENTEPYIKFNDYYYKALQNKQDSIQAVCISSLNKDCNEVESRYVNLKYIIKNEWIFFSNYESQKAKDFESHNKISALFYWNSIDLQIRIKANIFKSSTSFSDKHFQNRNKEKNAIAISSSQSQPVNSYEEVVNNYKKVMSDGKLLQKRPNYWGGYSFKPYFFEFWRGHESRINKRIIYNYIDNQWVKGYKQP